MQISSQFTIAVHLLLCVQAFSSHTKVTSDFIAGSTNINAAIIRKLMIQLQRADLIKVIRGPGGIELTRDIAQISLFDIYSAIECIDESIFSFHPNPNEKCPIGNSIHHVLDIHLEKAQQAMEAYLKTVSISDLISGNSYIESHH